jgi:uncharacterized protein involved in type VI secretion and phage assembly
MKSGDNEMRSLQDQVARSAQRERRSLHGVYRGRVENVGTATSGTEKRLGQLQISIPAVWGDKTSDLPWADPVVPFAGDGYGALMLPKQGDGVYVLFEGGSPEHPIWIGGFWSVNASLPTPAGEKARVIVTPNGHQVVLDDSSDTIQLTHSSGNKITIDKTSIKLEVNNGGKIEIGASGVKINDTALSVDK